MSDLSCIVCIVGPTSSGKTTLSLILAKQFKGEIINADARQLYRGFDIGTGKPSLAERQTVPHHLFDEDPRHALTMIEWRDKALASINAVTARDHLPILVGGTGLYFRALIDSLAVPAVPPQIQLRHELAKLSLGDLISRLHAIAPNVNAKVDLKNPRRVIRALEIALTGCTSLVINERTGPPLVDALQIGIKRSREELYARADAAVDEMIDKGWLNEIHDIGDFDAIGYRELLAVVEGRVTLAAVIPRIKQATRHYIKRQITWFKKDPRINWVDSHEQAIQLVEKWYYKTCYVEGDTTTTINRN